jgi:uncharacterized membrane protein
MEVHMIQIAKFPRIIFATALLLAAVAASAITLVGPNVKDNALVIPKAGIGAKAVFFPFTLDGVKMEVFAVKASDGTIRTALNTCQVCFDSGRGWYVQEGKEMVCQNCGNRFSIDKIELVKNGCNPIPVTKDLKAETKDSITISAAVLASGKQFFGRWKK